MGLAASHSLKSKRPSFVVSPRLTGNKLGCRDVDPVCLLPCPQQKDVYTYSTGSSWGRPKSQRNKVHQEMHIFLKVGSHSSKSRHSKFILRKVTIWTDKAWLAEDRSWTRKSLEGQGGGEMEVARTMCEN